MLPATASGADCGVPGPADESFDAVALDVQGDLAPQRTGSYLQIPFEVPEGTTAIRVRYSYDQLGLCGSGNNTLDLGVYEPRRPGETDWGPEQVRGWSGSAVRDAAIAINAHSDDATYDSARTAFVHGRTTRAYRPGPIPPGVWAVELGAGWIDPLDLDGVHWRVRVETSSSPDWSTGAPYEPTAPGAVVADSDADWYAGDLHLHGEMEPGNATMAQTLDYAFRPPSSGGAGLDFVTLVDHNNDVAHAGLGVQQAAHPGKLVLPGTEVTTYRGHHNNQASGTVVDFRGGPIYRIDPEAPNALIEVQDPATPGPAFETARAGGGWSQVNHPTIFRQLPSLCRGCAWGYSQEEAPFGSVDAIEIQTGPAALSLVGDLIFNPFTTEAIALYEGALDAGHRIAAVGASDDHQGGAGSGATYSPAGRATTMVGAEQLSRAGIVEAIRAGRTYVKLFGNDGPAVSFTARLEGGGTATIGDDVTAPSARLEATVRGAASTGRPGIWRLDLLRAGAPVASVPFAGDSFDHDFGERPGGRYALRVVRTQGVVPMIETYTSPLWLSLGEPPAGGREAASQALRVRVVAKNRRKGRAVVRVEAPGPGRIALYGRGLRKRVRDVATAGAVRLGVVPHRKLARKLRRTGRARPRVSVRFAGVAGETKIQTIRVGLKRIRRP